MTPEKTRKYLLELHELSPEPKHNMDEYFQSKEPKPKHEREQNAKLRQVQKHKIYPEK